MAIFISENNYLMKYWDNEKNNISPNEAKIKSHKKFWWICDNGHSYEQVAYSKTKGIGCPYCSGKLAIKGQNDLKTLHPELTKEWNYEKNNASNYKIETITIGSTKKVWWICNKGHSYQRSIYDRLHGKRNCPYCSNKKVLSGFNDLITTNPELLKEWNYNKNNELGIKPNEITNGGTKKVWWICNKGHEWNSIIKSRINGHGCPFCSNNKVLKGYNDLETSNPEIINLWNYSKNENLTPDMFSHGSTKKVWWIGDKGHEWFTSISSVTRGNRCPFCANQKILSGYNDLETNYPDIIQYWDYKKNSKKPNEVSPNSNKKAWWICNKGHSYSMVISAKTRGNYHSCPICNKYKRVSVPEKIIFYYLKKKYDDIIENYKPDWIKPKEIDIYIPSINVGIEYDGFRYHDDINKDLEKDNLCKIQSVSLIRIRELECPEYISDSIKIKLKSSYSQSYKHIETGLTELFDMLKLKIDINVERDLPEVLNIVNIGNKNNCIAVNNPEVLDEWNYEKNEKMNITPYNVTKGTSIKAWWLCDKGHSYKASIAIKINQNTKCPYCTGKKVFPGFNDVATTHPKLLKEWNYNKNNSLNIYPNQVTKGFIKKVWWICKNKHSYEALIMNKIKGDGCPYCSGRRVLKGFNDIGTLYPELKLEWDYEKNNKLNYFITNFTYGNDTKVWWICKNGHHYLQKINSKTIQKSHCPYCENKIVLKGFNDIATTNPEMLEEWDFEKNTISPYDVTSGSDLRVWWICDKGHSFDSKIANKKNGKGCPYCSGTKVWIGFNDLATTHPEVLINWDYEKNSENGITPYNISKSYSKKIWWKCQNGHSYQREVYNQRNGSGKCPICKKAKQL